MPSKFRGAQTAPLSPPDSITSLFSYKANIFRYQITDITGQNDSWTRAGWEAFVRAALDHLDTLLPFITTQKVVIDIHSPPRRDGRE